MSEWILFQFRILFCACWWDVKHRAPCSQTPRQTDRPINKCPGLGARLSHITTHHTAARPGPCQCTGELPGAGVRGPTFPGQWTVGQYLHSHCQPTTATITVQGTWSDCSSGRGGDSYKDDSSDASFKGLNLQLAVYLSAILRSPRIDFCNSLQYAMHFQHRQHCFSTPQYLQWQI